ncbi:cysteine and histidine-rich domain-containing protein morgana isoform X2 [Bacillus rossius redtenbacheri]|uniref:cysteine and histidine-rich domain-containing protein morgana isoform X2 n=1 Tax=Bacillus rossius redtenbacheri TaxID=93214 RepID=UPI002FDD3161
MPSENTSLSNCYNRGCGQKFDPRDNKPDSCTFHPGAPFFHDAYKGWSCCKKKCTDFTEFLNIKGCTRSYHSDVKPPEPERPVVDKSTADEVIEVKAPRQPVPEPLARSSFDTPLVTLRTEVSPGLSQELQRLVLSPRDPAGDAKGDGATPVGTSCKNNSCKATYEGPDSNAATCRHHPGTPVFHEGLKFWSCCQRRTTDFNSFLEQEGCTSGSHVWLKETAEQRQRVSCRYDWHQTGGFVVVSVFAKRYDPARSQVEASPVRLRIHLFFPEEEGSFDLDVELRGVVDVGGSSANMLPSKLEVKLRKAESGSWPALEFARPSARPPSPAAPRHSPEGTADDLVDLSDL